jgi:hypothetical protein
MCLQFDVSRLHIPQASRLSPRRRRYLLAACQWDAPYSKGLNSADGFCFCGPKPDGGDSDYSGTTGAGSSVPVSVSATGSKSPVTVVVVVPAFGAFAFGYQLNRPNLPLGSLWKVTVFFAREFRSD